MRPICEHTTLIQPPVWTSLRWWKSPRRTLPRWCLRKARPCPPRPNYSTPARTSTEGRNTIHSWIGVHARGNRHICARKSIHMWIRVHIRGNRQELCARWCMPQYFIQGRSTFIATRMQYSGKHPVRAPYRHAYSVLIFNCESVYDHADATQRDGTRFILLRSLSTGHFIQGIKWFLSQGYNLGPELDLCCEYWNGRG